MKSTLPFILSSLLVFNFAQATCGGHLDGSSKTFTVQYISNSIEDCNYIVTIPSINAEYVGSCANIEYFESEGGASAVETIYLVSTSDSRKKARIYATLENYGPWVLDLEIGSSSNPSLSGSGVCDVL